MNIKKIEIDIVERNLEFVGDNVFQSSGVTGGIVHQGILRIFAENGFEGNCIIGAHRGDNLSKINSVKNFANIILSDLSSSAIITFPSTNASFQIRTYHQPEDKS